MPSGNSFYNTRAWRDRTRRRIMLETNFPCADCGVQLPRGMNLHHRKELKRAPALGHEPMNLMPLCVSCHNRAHGKQMGCDVDGNPIGDDHPWNRQPLTQAGPSRIYYLSGWRAPWGKK